MKALFMKELKMIFCSLSGAFFSLSFLLISGLLLWGFSGSYNILDNGHASMGNFFCLSVFLFIFLIPALAMRSFSEERKSKTLDLLYTRPLTTATIYFSKYVSLFLFVCFTLLPTLVYVWSLSQLAYPTGNIDILNIVVSYLSLLLLVAVFVAIGLFASAITANQVAAFIFSAVLSAFAFYGFELIAQLFLSGKIQIAVSSLGLYYNSQLIQKGVVQLDSLIGITCYLFLFIALALSALNRNKTLAGIAAGYVLFVNIILVFVPVIRFDFTEDKRYSVSDYSKQLLQQVENQNSNLKIDIWLDGDLNSEFQLLQNRVSDLLTDLNSYTENKIAISFRNPYTQYKNPTSMYESMSRLGMDGIVLNEVDREGKASQKVIYPYAQVSNGQDTLVVSFLKNIKGYTAVENINASIESLEYEFVDAIRLMVQREQKNIAFIEGHGELPRSYVYDAEDLLSKYYSVNRGQIGNEVGVLDGFEAVIIAGPLQKYTEVEKYILDQYIMSGGKVLWLIDGAYYSHDDLSEKGQSASIKNETNLDDLLFTYGVRVNADLVQDKQCSSIYIMSGDDTRSSVLYPCYYMPLLIPSSGHPVTKDIRDVMSAFVSSIDIVNNNQDIRKTVLLTTSGYSRIVKVPDIVDLHIDNVQNNANHFDQKYLPAAVSLEGVFQSAFATRMVSDSVQDNGIAKRDKSNDTKMIVVSSSQIIRNDIEGSGNNSRVVPMGFDKVSNTQFGNRSFIVNAVNWLTDDAGLMKIRAKQQKIRILDKQKVYDKHFLYTGINNVLPILFVSLVMISVFIYRKKKYRQ